MRSLLAGRVGSQVVGSLALFLILVLGGLLYASVGSVTRDILVTQMLINAMMVVGIQLFIGNTGILSFGHIGFAGIASATKPDDTAVLDGHAPVTQGRTRDRKQPGRPE